MKYDNLPRFMLLLAFRLRLIFSAIEMDVEEQNTTFLKWCRWQGWQVGMWFRGDDAQSYEGWETQPVVGHCIVCIENGKNIHSEKTENIHVTIWIFETCAQVLHSNRAVRWERRECVWPDVLLRALLGQHVHVRWYRVRKHEWRPRGLTLRGASPHGYVRHVRRS